MRQCQSRALHSGKEEPDPSLQMPSNTCKGKRPGMGGPSLFSFLAPSSHLPMGILSSSGSRHRRNLSLEVFPPLPSPTFQEPGNDTTTRQNTTFPKSPVHPHFPSCFPKRFKLNPVPLHVVDKLGELFLPAGRRGRGRKEGLPSRTSFSGGSHGGQGGVEERSIKK